MCVLAIIISVGFTSSNVFSVLVYLGLILT